MEQSVEDAIKDFLSKQLLIEFNRDVGVDSDLFQLGLIDSYSYIELIRFVESTFMVKFTDTEMLSDVVVSLSGFTSLVCGKLAVHA